MTGQELYEWLQAIPEEDRRRARCTLEVAAEHEDLVTAKIYTEGDGKRIYLINK